MKKFFILTAVAGIFFIGCAEKPMAASVVDLAGNEKVIGWMDKGEVQNFSKVVVKYKPLDDTDKDGVPNYLDNCPATPENLSVNHYGCPVITDLRIHFDIGKTEIKKIYYSQLKKIADILKNNPKLKVEISGYTDNMGDERHNLELSEKRAKAVKDVLVNKFGIKPERIITKGYGEKYPLVPNTTETNRALNRRVEIVNISNKQ